MAVFSHRGLRWLLLTGSLAGLSVCLSACGSLGTSLSNTTTELADSLTPYKVEVVQGNFVSKEQAQAIQSGMSRQQVREILGTPLLVSAFHNNRWDYVFTIQRQGVEDIARRLTVIFNDDLMDHVEGDEMPTEVDFVSRLDPRRKPPAPPPLVATEAELSKFPLPKPAAEDSITPVLPNTYPPLEPVTR